MFYIKSFFLFCQIEEKTLLFYLEKNAHIACNLSRFPFSPLRKIISQIDIVHVSKTVVKMAVFAQYAI